MASEAPEPTARPLAPEPPVRALRWEPCYRGVPSRFPPIDLFERVAPPEDWAALIELESLTNERLRDELGQIQLVPPGERVVGPGAGYVMAPFTHIAPEGGRFNDPSFGAYYAARSLATAVAETRYHRARVLRATGEPPMELDMRVLEARLAGSFHDLRDLQGQFPAVYAPEDYSAGQALARRLRAAGADGAVFDSVRDAGGECAAAFRPRLLARCRETRTLTYIWDGEKISGVYEKKPFPPARPRRKT